MSRTSGGPHSRSLTIVAQDPSLTRNGKILTTQVHVPAERLGLGPWGYRIQVIDYDSSTETLFKPWDGDANFAKSQSYDDPYSKSSSKTLLNDPRFHAQNTYAIAMRVLAKFEFALGRRVAWSFPSHQLKIAPHAFRDANAYYSRSHEALQFGYFQGQNGWVYSCLSHDVVAHETTHAILDGLHNRFVDPSTPDQAAFHEGFSDVVALLSVFSLPDVVATILSGDQSTHNKPPTISRGAVRIPQMRKSILLGLAEQLGHELIRGRPLRQSLLLKPSTRYLSESEYQEPHRRGEIFVAAMMNAFLHVFDERVNALDRSRSNVLDLERVVEEAAKAADHLLTISIRALDYCMPVHLTFSDYLSALITSDTELVTDDTYHYRDHLRRNFADFGIIPSSPDRTGEVGQWIPASEMSNNLNYQRSHFQMMQYDEQEIFRFLWENRDQMKLRDDVYTRVIAVRPCLRLSPEGFFLRETIVQFIQLAEIRGDELKRFKVKRPVGMQASDTVKLQGGGTLVFDQHGRLKYHIISAIDSERQSDRVEYLWRQGYFRNGRHPVSNRDFQHVHRLRAMGQQQFSDEAWV